MSTEESSCGTMQLAARVTTVRRSLSRDDHGQALVEMGIVLILFVILVLGVLEFGRAWMVANMITHAARDGARAAAVVTSVNRDSNGNISGGKKTAIENQVMAQIDTVLPAAQRSSFSASVTQDTVNGIPVVEVTVTGRVNYMFNLIGPDFGVARTVTFRDEGR